MSVRVARMQNGEDVIADIKEIRPDATGKEFFPWSPLSTGRNIVTLYSVVAISEPHSNVVDGWQQAIKKYKEIKKDDAKVDHTQTPPTAVFVGEDNGTGRGTESTD